MTDTADVIPLNKIREPVTGHVHHVVHAAEQPEVAVVVELGAVASEVTALEP